MSYAPPGHGQLDPGVGGGTACGSAGPRPSRRAGSTGGASVRPWPRARSRTQRKPKQTAMTAPATTIAQLTTRPTSSATTPSAKPTGHRLGPGTCGCSRLGSKSSSGKRYELPLARFSSLTEQLGRTMTNRRPRRRDCRRDAVLGPARVDEVADLGAHLDLRRPIACAFGGSLGRGVDPELAAQELPGCRMVEMVGGPVAEDDVPRRVDVRPHVERHLLVV